jgi:PhzF family phenazine biosynthesis protein
VLASEGRIKRGRAVMETNVGLLALDIDRARVMMDLAPPRVEAVELRRDDLAHVLRVPAIHPERPVQKASCGMWVLLVPMADQAAVNLCQPDLSELAALNLELGVEGTHLFSIESDGTLYTRFFAPVVGIPEDPVTGTANGALGAYLIENELAKGPEFRARQGDAMGRPGEVEIYATAKAVRVGGKAVILSRGSITF